MAEAQVSTLVGGHQVVDEGLAAADEGKSPLSDAAFAATKDVNKARAALKSVSALFGNIYSDSYLDSLTLNDMVFDILSNEDVVTAAAGSATAWAASTEYARGAKVTNSSDTLQAMNSGTSGATAPANPASVGGTVVDNDITWVRIA